MEGAQDIPLPSGSYLVSTGHGKTCNEVLITHRMRVLCRAAGQIRFHNEQIIFALDSSGLELHPVGGARHYLRRQLHQIFDGRGQWRAAGFQRSSGVMAFITLHLFQYCAASGILVRQLM